jgi:hypothetical protein
MATRVTEALAQQALEDIDQVLGRIAAIDAKLGETLQLAVKQALGESVFSAEMRLQEVTREQAQKLRQAGIDAGTELREIITSPEVRIIAGALSGKVRMLLLIVVGVGLASGAVGAIIGSLLHL